MKAWRTLTSKEVFSNPWLRVRSDTVLNQNDKELTYGVVEMHHPSVFIVAVNSDGKILIQDAYRYTVDKIITEIPAGHADGDEMLVAAKRELIEETGLVSDDWIDLGRLYQAVGIGNIPLQVFLAKDVHVATDERDEHEPITNQRFMSIEKIELMAKNNTLQNAPVLAALYLAKLHKLK